MTEHGSPLTVEQILAWADAYRARTKQWPHARSGDIAEAPGLSWLAIDNALRKGQCGLSGSSSLAALLAEYRDKRCKALGSPLAMEQILTWARAHQRRSGLWPTVTSGQVVEAPRQRWSAIDRALRSGFR